MSEDRPGSAHTQILLAFSHVHTLKASVFLMFSFHRLVKVISMIPSTSSMLVQGQTMFTPRECSTFKAMREHAVYVMNQHIKYKDNTCLNLRVLLKMIEGMTHPSY